MALIDTLLWLGVIVIFLTLIGLIVTLAVIFKKYDKSIHLKQIVNGNLRYRSVRARLKEQDNVRFWLALKKVNGRKFFSVPPPEVVYTDNKGKENADAYIDGEGTFRWYSDPNATETFSLESLKSLKPMNSSERSLYVHELKKANRRKAFDLFQIIPGALNVIMIIFLVIGSMLFWEQQGEMMSEANDKASSIAGTNAKTTQLLIETFKNERTLVETEPDDGGEGIAPN